MVQQIKQPSMIPKFIVGIALSQILIQFLANVYRKTVDVIPSIRTTALYLGGPDRVPGSELQPGSGQTYEGNWVVIQRTENLFLLLSFLMASCQSASQINYHKKKVVEVNCNKVSIVDSWQSLHLRCQYAQRGVPV